MVDEPEGRAPPAGGGVPETYHQAYCFQCAAEWHNGIDRPPGEDYPGHYDLDQQNIADWAIAHCRTYPDHVVDLRAEVRAVAPTGVP